MLLIKPSRLSGLRGWFYFAARFRAPHQAPPAQGSATTRDKRINLVG